MDDHTSKPDHLLEELALLRARVQELETQRDQGIALACPPDGRPNLTWETLIEALPSAVGIVYVDGQFAAANRRWREILGSQSASTTIDAYMQQVRILRPDRTPFPHDQLPRLQALRTGAVVRNQEAILYMDDGTEIPVLVSAAPIRDAQGEIVASALVFDDISEFKRMQEQLAKGLKDVSNQAFLLRFSEALRPAEESSRILELATHMLGEYFDADHVSYCQMEKDGSFYTIMHDHHREGVAPNFGRHSLDNSHPRFAAGLRAGKTIIARDVFTECDLTPDQQDLYSRQKLTAFVTVPLVKNKRLIAFLRIQFEKPHDWQRGDVSLIEEVAERTWAAVERAQAEAVTQQTLVRLENRTQELDAIIASIPDGLVIYNSRINPVYMNEGAKRFFERYQIQYNLDFDERAEKAIILDEHGRRLKKEEWAIYRSCVHGETIRDFIQLSVAQGGQSYYTSVSCAPIRDEQGHITGAVSTLKDITQQKHVELRLRESEQRALALVESLKIADQNKSHFISVLSHELRNPLAAIVMSQGMLKQVPPDSNPGRRAWEAMERQTNILIRLVDDLLDVTRINENKTKLRLEHVDLTEVIRRAVSDSQAQFEQKGITLNHDLPAEPLSMDVDPVRITQVIGNLLHNALKFTRAGDSVLVSMRTEQGGKSGREVVIRVADTGMGIEPEILRNMFQPFTQADRSLARTQGGLGLGLSIVRGMVELHGGTVEAASEGIGKGSTFTIRLPL